MFEPVSTSCPRLLLVDDDRALAGMLREYLEMQGFEVHAVTNGEEALTVIADSPPDLVVLDVGLPGMDGFETLTRLRVRQALPVIMLTARGDEPDRIAGLIAGADDYLPKPFNPLELTARIRAVLKRSANQSAVIKETLTLGFGNLVLHVKRREVEVGGVLLALTATELRILEVLLQRRGEVLSRAELTEMAVGRPLEAYDRSIDTLISKLRRKLAGAGTQGAEIRSLRGHGYVLDIAP